MLIKMDGKANNKENEKKGKKQQEIGRQSNAMDGIGTESN
jgi:hypothetical protein